MAEQELDLALSVNAIPYRVRVPSRRLLSDCLRHDLKLTGTHVGCEHGVCGACTVRVDGAIARACLMLAVQADGARVETIEGVAGTGEVFDLQQAFAEENALQCGFCTPGMLLTAQDLLSRRPDAGSDEIREALSGNYCRCTGYHAMVDAIRKTSESRRRGTGGGPHR
jgi:aerobic carbon-monoxide dehydrogenase small subunit